MKTPRVRRACPINEGFEGERDELSDERVQALIRRFRDKQAIIASLDWAMSVCRCHLRRVVPVSAFSASIRTPSG